MLTGTAAIIYFITGGLIIASWSHAENISRNILYSGFINISLGVIYLVDLVLTTFTDY
jgi:hypothetical protein